MSRSELAALLALWALALAFAPALAQSPAAMPPAPGRILPVRSASLAVLPRGEALVLEAGVAGTLELPRKLLGLGAGEHTLFQVATEPFPVTIRWRSGRTTSEWLVGNLPQADLFCYDFEAWRLRSTGAAPQGLALALLPADPMIAAETLAYHSQVLVFGLELPNRGGLVATYLPEEAPPERCGLFQWSAAQGRWRFLAPARVGQTVTLDSLAPLVVAEDLAPPILRQPRYAAQADGLRLVIPLTDPESGIDPASIRVQGATGLLTCSYDAAAGLILLPEEASGPFVVRANDRAGNKVELTGLSP